PRPAAASARGFRQRAPVGRLRAAPGAADLAALPGGPAGELGAHQGRGGVVLPDGRGFAGRAPAAARGAARAVEYPGGVQVLPVAAAARVRAGRPAGAALAGVGGAGDPGRAAGAGLVDLAAGRGRAERGPARALPA